MQGNELAFISEKVFSWGPTFEIYRGGTLAAVVKKTVFTLSAPSSRSMCPAPTIW